MNRRKFIGAILVGSLAGCAGGNTDGSEQATVLDSPTSTNSPRPTESPTPTDSPTPSPEPASFELVSVSAPDKAEIGEQITYEFTVRNTGEQAGEFETTISAKTPGGRFSAGEPWKTRIRPDEEITLGSEAFSVNVMTEAIYRIDEFDHTFSIQFVSRRLEFEQSYTTPDGITLTVNRIEFKDSYTVRSGSYTSEQRPDEGNKWAFVYIRSENNAGSPTYAPTGGEFVLVSGNSQYDSEISLADEGRYEGGEIQPGVVREGWILYEVPESLGAGDIEVVWSDTTYNGDVAVYWSQSGE